MYLFTYLNNRSSSATDFTATKQQVVWKFGKFRTAHEVVPPLAGSFRGSNPDRIADSELK